VLKKKLARCCTVLERVAQTDRLPFTIAPVCVARRCTRPIGPLPFTLSSSGILSNDFPPTKEDSSAGWISHEESCGRAPSKAQTRQFAAKILAADGDTSRIGKQWTDDFIRRNPDIKSEIQKPLSATRAKYTTKGVVINYFHLLEWHATEKDIKTANISRMDESCVQEGETERGRVLGTCLTNCCYKSSLIRRRGPPFLKLSPLWANGLPLSSSMLVRRSRRDGFLRNYLTKSTTTPLQAGLTIISLSVGLKRRYICRRQPLRLRTSSVFVLLISTLPK
jgi:hypothetical protein